MAGNICSPAATNLTLRKWKQKADAGVITISSHGRGLCIITALDVGISRSCHRGCCLIEGCWWYMQPVDIYHPPPPAPSAVLTAYPTASLLSAVSKSPHKARRHSTQRSAAPAMLTFITDIRTDVRVLLGSRIKNIKFWQLEQMEIWDCLLP